MTLILAAAVLLALGISQTQAQNGETCCPPSYKIELYLSGTVLYRVYYSSETFNVYRINNRGRVTYSEYGTGRIYESESDGSNCTFTYHENREDFSYCITHHMVFKGHVTLFDTVYYKWFVTEVGHPFYQSHLYWDASCIFYPYPLEAFPYEPESHLWPGSPITETFNKTGCQGRPAISISSQSLLI